MSTTLAKLRGLVESLYSATIDGEIEWKLAADKQMVWASISTFRMEINEESGDSFENDIRITIYDREGDQVDTFTDLYFQNTKPTLSGLSNYYRLMNGLLEAARRKASGADEALDKILKSLGGSAVEDTPPLGGFAADLDDDNPF